MKKGRIGIAGAGIIGCMCALKLAEDGWDVALYDRASTPFTGVSSAGFGSLTPYSDPFFVGEARDFAARGVALYKEEIFPALPHGDIDLPAFEDSGLLQLCESETDCDELRTHVSLLISAGYKAQFISSADVALLEPCLTCDIKGAALLDEPWIDRDILFNTLLESLNRKETIKFYGLTTIIGISEEGDEALLHLSTGERRSFDKIVVANGLNLYKLDGMSSFPMSYIRGDAIQVRTPNNMPLLRRHIYMNNGFITPRRDGRLLLGATYLEDNPAAVGSMRTDTIAVMQVISLLEANRRILPALETCEVDKMWRNWRSTPPDKMPILGAAHPTSTIVIATGFIGLGITMAPAVAAAVSHYFNSGDANQFPVSFSPNRF